MTDQQKIADILNSREYFDLYFPPIEGCDARQDIPYRLSNSCPSCGYLTLDTRCRWDICTFCFWEDDGQDNNDADKICGGPNSDYSLTSHRLEIYDWMRELKNESPNDKNIEFLIGQELKILDNCIINKDINQERVLAQITLLSELFGNYRGFESVNTPSWKFISEKQMTKIKPAL